LTREVDGGSRDDDDAAVALPMAANGAPQLQALEDGDVFDELDDTVGDDTDDLDGSDDDDDDVEAEAELAVEGEDEE
jgi:hypothetical protein